MRSVETRATGEDCAKLPTNPQPEANCSLPVCETETQRPYCASPLDA